ncbi:MAG TPA: 2-phospho-L-lactate guanylyltransferase [Acidimicrobiales bacterium]|nr:2-phospho-L-lactate guanylyltransferase [Acidimicrobiales bacterium]
MSSAGDLWRGRPAVLVPVKAFHRAKVRLAPALSPERRRDLARQMATRVVSSAGGLPVAVVCDDEEVAGWAESLGATVVWEPGRGLNQAVTEGVRHLGSLGVAAVIVAAGDLPLVTDVTWVADFDGVTLVPDRREDGTNVIGLPAATSFTFSYGPGSFARHVEEAHRSGMPVRVVRSAALAWDVDLPEDLVGLAP